jgi:ribosomal protein S18 acetylase RimI-like enzyme
VTDIRAARQSDLDDVVRVFLGCWRVSYAPSLPADLVAQMTDEAAVELWEKALASTTTDTRVATQEDRVVGIVSYRLVDDPDEAPYEGYVASLYVDPTTQGGGIGRTLMAAAERELRVQGATTAYLWVFADNAPSRAFYERIGWLADGEVVTPRTWGGHPQARYAKVLTDR